MASENAKNEIISREETAPKRPLMPIIVDHQEMIKDFLPGHVDAEKFFLVANGVLRGNSYLRGCLDSKKGVAGFLGSLKQAAMDGLMPDGKREAAIVPYGGVPTYVRMYGGMLKMMRQSGVIADINTGLVCENDEFDFGRGTRNYVHHKVAFSNRGKKIAAWCVIRTKDGGEYFDIMGADEINQIKRASKAKNGPWSNAAHEGQMWRKTVLRRTAGLAPISTDMQNAFAREDEENYNFDHLQRPSAADRLKANMEAKDRGQITDIDPANYEEPEDGKLKPDAPKKSVILSKDPRAMDGDEWKSYTDDLIKELSTSGMAGDDFNKIYSLELGHIANYSVENYDRVLDAMESAGQASEKE